MKYRYQSGEMVYEVLLERHGDGYRVTVGGEHYHVEVLDAQPGALSLRFGPVEHPERSGFPQQGTESKHPERSETKSKDPSTPLHSAQDAIRPQVVYWGAEGDVKWLSSGGCTYRLEKPQERTRSGGRGRGGSGTAAEDLLRAPMPAQVRAVQVAEGDAVEAGQTLLLLEAMKMEIKLTSPRAATVCRLLAKQGETVEKDQVLVELE